MQVPASNLFPNRFHRLVGNCGTEVDEELSLPIFRSSRPKRLSRPMEFHRRPLAEPSVRLSPHSAPIRQTRRPYRFANGRRDPTAPYGTVCLSHASRSSCFQLFRSCNRLTRPLCSSPITGPSSLVRVGPPQCSASVLSSRGFGRLHFSLHIGATGSCSSVQSPASGSRPLYAGRHPPSHQAPRGFIPDEIHASGFDDA